MGVLHGEWGVEKIWLLGKNDMGVFEGVGDHTWWGLFVDWFG